MGNRAGEVVAIRDLGRVVTGRTPSTLVDDYFGNDFPFLTPSDMNGQKTIRVTERSISHKGAAVLRNSKVPAGAIAVSCIGWQMGKVAIIAQPSFTNQQINAIIPNGRADPDFLYYSLSTRRDELKNLGSVGTRTPILNKSRFEELTLVLPPLLIQRKIAGILSAYDDLIENNMRRIAILDEMARELYREWFVRFRFPGHLEQELSDDELGLLPVGWPVRIIRDEASFINRGVSPRYDDEADGIVINQRCIRNGNLSLDEARRHATSVPVTKYVQPGDVLINSTGVGTLGRVAQVLDLIPNCTVDSHVSIVRPSEAVNEHYFGMTLLALQPVLETRGIGSTGQTELGRDAVASVPFVMPPRDLQDLFGTFVAPMRHAATILAKKNANLRSARDLLLPKLVSGEVDVESLTLEGVFDEEGSPAPLTAGH